MATAILGSGIAFADDPAALYRSTIPEDTVTYSGNKLTANVLRNESHIEITLSQQVNVSASEQLKVVPR